MAWSDAARAAALEVRRAHASAKKMYAGTYSTVLTSRQNRAQLAYDLKDMRRRGGLKEPGARTWIKNAVISTATRNAQRGRVTLKLAGTTGTHASNRYSRGRK